MSTTDPTVSHANAQDMLRALKTERAGYEQRGMKDRVEAVDEQIAHWAEVARNAPVDPDAAGEVRQSDTAINAEKMIEALKAEKAGLEGRDGKAKRVAAIDEQIRHYTGVLRKENNAGAPVNPRGGSAAGRQTRTA